MNPLALSVMSSDVEPLLPGLWGLTPVAGMLGMVVLLYLFLITGRLITKSSHEREVAIYKSIIDSKDATIKEQSSQITSLLSVGNTVKAFLVAAGPEELREVNDSQPGGD